MAGPWTKRQRFQCLSAKGIYPTLHPWVKTAAPGTNVGFVPGNAEPGLLQQ